jgi:hypothetical protein
MLNVFVVAGALFLIGTVAVYAWLTRTEKPITPAATLPKQAAAELKGAAEQNAPEPNEAAEQNASESNETDATA